MPPHPDTIADCVLAAFHALPAKFKPRKLDNARREWVPLAGIVLSRDRSPTPLTCAALATGMKCLPHARVKTAKGNVLHDSHAEVLAIRAFNRWLVDECADLAKADNGTDGQWLTWRRLGHALSSELDEGSPVLRSKDITWDDGGTQHDAQQTQPFAIQDDVQIHMYCSEAPCGDASMELIMAGQEDATPWSQGPLDDEMLGRGNFDQLGIVRRKPARPDAPLALSKSCSDKLARKQCTSLLSRVTSTLVYPGNAYLTTLVLPESQYVPKAVERAFGANGRLREITIDDVQARWRESGHAFKPFEVMTTGREFEYSRRASAPDVTLTPSDLAALWTPSQQEVLINGVLQGRKQSDPKGASCVSRRRMWEAALDVVSSVGLTDEGGCLKERTYAALRAHERLGGREVVKRDAIAKALQGWKENGGDDEWSLEQ